MTGFAFLVSESGPTNIAEVFAEGEALQVIDHDILRAFQRGFVTGPNAHGQCVIRR
ncbi:hypothetical protein DFP91_1075 [Pseudorhodoplanes sinuspersici]|nr:hypothetical protein DFP91_1075 [Pseudorhodoplanes sinuspersici]